MFEKDSPERTSHREKRDFSVATKMPPGDPCLAAFARHGFQEMSPPQRTARVSHQHRKRRASATDSNAAPSGRNSLQASLETNWSPWFSRQRVRDLRLDNVRCLPPVHGRIKMEPKEMFESYYIDRCFIVCPDRFDPGGHDDINARLEHCFQIPDCDSLIDSCQKKSQAASAFGYNLPPSLPQCPLDRKND